MNMQYLNKAREIKRTILKTAPANFYFHFAYLSYEMFYCLQNDKVINCSLINRYRFSLKSVLN